MNLEGARCSKTRVDEPEETLTDEVALILEIQLNFFLSFFERNESRCSFFRNPVEFWTDAFRDAA